MIPILSIIIPIYKVESYLKDSIDSVLNQSLNNYEIILINDGSPDNCGTICEEYAQKDNRIRVLHKENGGLSSARNAGLNIASGQYITFVDSDDIVGPNTYAPNMDILLSNSNIDMLEYPAYIYYNSPYECKTENKTKEIVGKHTIFIEWMKKEGYNNCYVWNKIYKRELFDNITFPEGKNFEDVNTFPFILEQCNHIYISELGLYYYYYRTQSITQNANREDYYNLLNGHLIIQQKAKIYNQQLKKELFIHYLHINNIFIDFSRRTNKTSTTNELMTKIIRYKVSFKDYMKLDISLRNKIKNISLNFIGPRFHYFCYVTLNKLFKTYNSENHPTK